MLIFFSILFGLAVAVCVVAVVVERSGAQARVLEGRLRGGRSDTVDSRDAKRDVRYSVIPWVDRMLRRMNVGEALEMLLYQAGMTMRVGMLVTFIAAAGMTGYLFGVIAFHRLIPGLIFMVMFAPIPYLYAAFRKSQRMKTIRETFPDALDLLVSGLRAGLSFSAAMQIVSEESPEPLRSEFAITVEEQALGLDMRDALINLTKRVDLIDLKFFVTAVLLQRETGGNLAEVLSNSATLIRDRFRVLGDIKTFTAQGKLSAVILVMLPVAVGLFTYLITPEYFKPMMESSSGRFALWVAAAMQLAGCFVIFRIVNIKV
jgi:tight adherence protein B